jgi:hypothetical protein
MKFLVIIILIILNAIETTRITITTTIDEKCNLECSLISKTQNCSCDRNCVSDCCKDILKIIDCENFFGKLDLNKNEISKFNSKKLSLKDKKQHIPMKSAKHLGLTPQIKIKYNIK